MTSLHNFLSARRIYFLPRYAGGGPGWGFSPLAIELDNLQSQIRITRPYLSARRCCTVDRPNLKEL